MVHCCVPKCGADSSKKDKRVTFHCFPRKDVLKEMWTAAVSSQAGGKSWSPSFSARICSLHFKESDFSISTTKRVLLPNTVPSVFSGSPVQLPLLNTVKHEVEVDESNELGVDKTEELLPEETEVEEMLSEDPLPLTTEVAVQVSVPVKKVRDYRKHLAASRKTNYNLRKTVSRLKEKVTLLRMQLKTKKSLFDVKIEEIKRNADEGRENALLLYEQILSYEPVKDFML